MSDCIFCKIAHREAPASVVYESDEVMAFLDIDPVQRGHTLWVVGTKRRGDSVY